ncbi:MAG: TlpA family protein disulfide reductase [Balneolales bacterium]|nr:TlpA family protein disulfide reductase [Balneolales bacterium]
MNTKSYFLILITIFLVSACAENGETVRLTGTVQSKINGEIVIELNRIHYKFSEPELIKVTPDQDGRFSTTFVAPESGLINIQINGYTFPLAVKNGASTTIHLSTTQFPERVRVSGFGSSFAEAYQLYLQDVRDTEHHLEEERGNFLKLQPNDYLNIHRLKIQLAKQHLADTPYSFIVQRNIGEYLVSRLTEIRMIKQYMSDFNAELARRSVLNEAIFLDFFSYESLRAQRAGIRDFAHAWIESTTIANRVKENYGQGLSTNEWKRIGNELVQEEFYELATHIKDSRAKGFAIMHFIAEEMAERDYDSGIIHFQKHASLLGELPIYHSFLESLKDRLDETKPGNPALDFRLTDSVNNTHTLSDFEGSYLLMEFWASWCPNCHAQLPTLIEADTFFSSKDFQILSISVDESEEAWSRYIERNHKPGIHVFDGSGFSQELFREYRAGSIPFYVLISRDGRILYKNNFNLSNDLINILEELLHSDLDHTYAGS